MKIFIDFDDVLFCTRDFKIDFKKVFENEGISSEEFEETYQTVRKSNDGVDGYNYDEHISILDKRGVAEKNVLEKAINDFLVNTEKYIFDDAINFLEKSKERGIELFMISFGSDGFQRRKVENSGLSKYFLDIRVGDINKAIEIKNIIGKNTDDEMWFIDDRVDQIKIVKKTFPYIKTILLKRNDGRYFEEMNEFCDFEAKDFEKVDKIINS